MCRCAREQRADIVGVEEGDGVAADAVVGAQYQGAAVATKNLQVGRRQAAADESQVHGQCYVGGYVEGAAAATVLDGGGQAQGIAGVDAGDVAVYRQQVGNAAGERDAGRARAFQVPLVPLTVPWLLETTPCWMASRGVAIEAISTPSVEIR